MINVRKVRRVMVVCNPAYSRGSSCASGVFPPRRASQGIHLRAFPVLRVNPGWAGKLWGTIRRWIVYVTPNPEILEPQDVAHCRLIMGMETSSTLSESTHGWIMEEISSLRWCVVFEWKSMVNSWRYGVGRTRKAGPRSRGESPESCR